MRLAGGTSQYNSSRNWLACIGQSGVALAQHGNEGEGQPAGPRSLFAGFRDAKNLCRFVLKGSQKMIGHDLNGTEVSIVGRSFQV